MGIARSGSSAAVALDSSLEGWSLLDPSSDLDRTFRYPVSFNQAFPAPPVVHVGIIGLDASNDDNLRVRVRAVNITATGFTLQAETWLGTKIWSIGVSWLAIGA